MNADHARSVTAPQFIEISVYQRSPSFLRTPRRTRFPESAPITEIRVICVPPEFLTNFRDAHTSSRKTEVTLLSAAKWRQSDALRHNWFARARYETASAGASGSSIVKTVPVPCELVHAIVP